MKINISLSEESIQSAINQLSTIKENIAYSVNDLVEVLAYDGAEEANMAYGSMVAAHMEPESMTEAKIVVPGGDKAIIAEFGAGYATMEYHPFASKAPVPIEVASFSKENFNRSMYGGLFYITNDIYPGEGYWLFGGNEYDRVQPRHGLLNANDYIVANSTRIAKEVFRL